MSGHGVIVRGHGRAAVIALGAAAGLAAGCERDDERAAGRGAARPPGPAPGALAIARQAPALAAAERPLSAAARAGRQLFFDPALSASGQMSCATCHDPAHAHGPPNDRAVQLGGPRGSSPGLRAVPSLRYKEFTPGYADLLDNSDGISPPGPGGGFGWDGRADSLAEQARIPLLSPFEMANATPADAVARLRVSASAIAFVAAFGPAVLADVDTAFADLALALQAYQLEDASFHPYRSKYDRYLERQPGGEFTPAEQRGFQVFIDPATGNCSGCHYAHASQDDGAPPQFTDFSFEAIGVPRNPQIPANRDRRHADLGLCGPVRGDHARFSELCGMFKTPTLRNVAIRRAFFHNGVMRSLDQALRFYNTRDTRPELWYPTLGGVVQKFDDLPPAFHRNVDGQLPLDGRPRGAAPPMTEQQLGDLACFLRTLTDDDVRAQLPPAAGCGD